MRMILIKKEYYHFLWEHIILNKVKFIKFYSLEELAFLLDAELILKKRCNCLAAEALSDFFSSNYCDIIIFNNLQYLKFSSNVSALAVVLKRSFVKYFDHNCLVVNDPRLALAKLTRLCLNVFKEDVFIHKSVIIGCNCYISKNVMIFDNVVIGDDVLIGSNCYIYSGVVIGNNCIIGESCVLRSNVVLYDNVSLGNRCFINANTTLGSDGFGFVKNEYFRWEKIFHFGKVVIGNDVDIGSNTSIDRGVFLNTVVKDGVIIDNQVQIAHNVVIGENSVIAGCVGIGGSVSIGKECLMGGASAISDHVFLSDRICISGFSGVTKSLYIAGLYSSVFPVKNSFKWNKNVYYFYNLEKLFNTKQLCK